MDQFQLGARTRNILIGFAGLGLVCLLMTFFNGDEVHSRFWSNLLHNSVFFTGVSLMALFFITVCITAYAGWHTQFKRVWEAFSMFLPIGFVLMAIIAIGIWGHWHHLYEWADDSIVANDEILTGKSGFLNKGWYTFGTLGIVAVWILFAYRLRNLSLAEDAQGTTEYRFYKQSKVWAAIFLPIAGFSSAAVIWQWIMSLEPHWYSTLFAWYTGASWFVSMICLTLLVLLYLKSKGHYPNVSGEHIHDLGKFLFAFSVFWTYLWFSQYMLIWYGNVGEETVYFQKRLQDYPVLFYANLGLNFFLPFLVLMRNDTKRKKGTITFAAIAVLFGHWLDFFLMIKPGVWATTQHVLHSHHGAEGAADHGAHEAAHGAAEHASNFVAGFSMPGLLEIGIFMGFTAFFLLVVGHYLGKASLVAKNDPFIAESVHHHV